MNIAVNHQQAANLYALEEIRSLPLMLDRPLFQNYPAMKLGRKEQIDFFSQKLFAVVIDLLQQQHSMGDLKPDWALTAPPYYELPAAANLLARNIKALLLEKGLNIPLVEQRLHQQHVAISNQAEFDDYYQYSKNNLQQRIAARRRVQQSLDNDAILQLKGRSVIIINDINVTGTQQSFMQETLNQLPVRECFWFYIFNVEKSFGARHPEIEHQINHSQLNDLDSFAGILADTQTEHTARCISRLFNENLSDFGYLVATLSKKTCAKIYQLAQNEGRYSSPLFNEKMALLEATSQNGHAF